MDDELRSHIQHRADDLERSGLSRAEAERRARIEFGGYERVQGGVPRSRRAERLSSRCCRICAIALRMLRKSPGFTVVAAGDAGAGDRRERGGVCGAECADPASAECARSGQPLFRSIAPTTMRQRSRIRIISICAIATAALKDLAAYNIAAGGLDTGNNPSRVWLYSVSGNYFDALGIQPYLGRFFHASDEHGPNSAPYIVLSHAYWHTHFQDDRGVVGRVVQLNKHPFTIVGVAPPEFHGTLLFFTPDFFVPIVNQEQVDGTSTPEQRAERIAIFMMLGHLKPGVTPAQAAADLNSIGAYLEKTYPNETIGIDVLSWRVRLVRRLSWPVRCGRFLPALMLLAGLILLAACANLGSLFAARAADRSREVALRLALGSSRARILRQLFTEAVLISLIGGALGLWGSVVAVALAERVAAISAVPDQRAGDVRTPRFMWWRCCWPCERLPVRRGAGAAGAAHQSVRDRQGGMRRRCSDAGSRCATCCWLRADRDLRGAGDVVAGRGARVGALAAQQFRFRAAECHAGGHQPGHGGLHGDCHARHAEAHDRRRGERFPAWRPWDWRTGCR